MSSTIIILTPIFFISFFVLIIKSKWFNEILENLIKPKK